MSGHYENPRGSEKKTGVKSITLTAIVVVVVVAVVSLVLNELFFAAEEEVFQETMLEPAPVSLLELREYEDSVLNSYELVDTAALRYRIPIDSAMKLLASEPEHSK